MGKILGEGRFNFIEYSQEELDSGPEGELAYLSLERVRRIRPVQKAPSVGTRGGGLKEAVINKTKYGDLYTSNTPGKKEE